MTVYSVLASFSDGSDPKGEHVSIVYSGTDRQQLWRHVLAALYALGISRSISSISKIELIEDFVLNSNGSTEAVAADGARLGRPPRRFAISRNEIV
jgi:hypothetical protein